MGSGLSATQKVLLALYRLSGEGKKKVRYEDIVVQAFKDYPADFHLKGYPDHPDSGDIVHKPLYEYRKKGMVSASNKMFSLTVHGITEARRVLAIERGHPSSSDSRPRLDRDAQIEVERIKRLESFRFFCEGKQNDIIDSDLYDYLGVSVRTSRNDFIGRLEAMKSAMAAVAGAENRDPVFPLLLRFHEFMVGRFADDIAYKTEGHR